MLTGVDQLTLSLESLALVSHLDVRLAGDQEVAGLTPAGSATLFLVSWALIMKYFLQTFSPAYSRKVAVPC